MSSLLYTVVSMSITCLFLSLTVCPSPLTSVSLPLSQFEDNVMDICFEILERARPALDRSQRWDPVYISRVVIAMVGENMYTHSHFSQRVLFLFMCVLHQANRTNSRNTPQSCVVFRVQMCMEHSPN